MRESAACTNPATVGCGTGTGGFRNARGEGDGGLSNCGRPVIRSEDVLGGRVCGDSEPAGPRIARGTP